MDNNEINTNDVVSTNNVTEASTNNTLNVNNTNDVGNGSNMNNQKPKNNKTVVICMAIIIIILLGIIGFLVLKSLKEEPKNNDNNSSVSDNNSNTLNEDSLIEYSIDNLTNNMNKFYETNSYSESNSRLVGTIDYNDLKTILKCKDKSSSVCYIDGINVENNKLYYSVISEIKNIARFESIDLVTHEHKIEFTASNFKYDSSYFRFAFSDGYLFVTEGKNTIGNNTIVRYDLKTSEKKDILYYGNDISSLFVYNNKIYFSSDYGIISYFMSNLDGTERKELTSKEFFSVYFDYKKIKINGIDDSKQSIEMKEKYKLVKSIYNECLDASCKVTKLLNYINNSNFDYKYYVNEEVDVESLEESGYYLTIYNIKYDDFKNKALTIMSENIFNKLFSKYVYDSNENGNLISRELAGGGNTLNMVYVEIEGSNNSYTAYEVYIDYDIAGSYGIDISSNNFAIKNENGNIVIDYIGD